MQRHGDGDVTETHLVGIDMEVSELRVTAYTPDGEKVLGATAGFEQDSTDDWARALREAAVYTPGDRDIVSAVGTSGTVVPVDEYGRQVFPPQWYFETAPEQADRISRLAVSAELSDRGLSVSASSPISKILALRESDPRRFERVEWLLSPTTWILYRLHNDTERRWEDLETDWNNALKFGADITRDEPDWFTPLFESVDLPLDLLPEITAPGAPIGEARSDLAGEMGLAGAELHQGLTDGNASVLAAGSLEPGDCSIICGSSSVVKYVSTDIDTHDALYYHRHPIEGYVAGAAFDTGLVLEWLCEKVMGISVERGLELARRTDPGGEPRAYLQGDRAPFFNPNVGTTLLDLWPDETATTEETRGAIVRGLATSIALSEYMFFPLLEAHFDEDIEPIHLVSGGEAEGRGPFTWWNVLRASIWERRVRKVEPRTTIGALIPAALEASLYDDVEEASDALLRYGGSVATDEEVRETYAAARDRFKSDWRTVHDLYELLGK